MKKVLAVSAFLTIAAAACISYDAPVIYHKNFQPGTNDSLRFDGYYTPQFEVAMYGKAKPIYLFKNGSVWFGEEQCPNALVNEHVKKGLSHSWGNYLVKGDTIYIERFRKAETSDNYQRITLKGAIMKDKIYFVEREEDRQNPVKIGYPLEFYMNSYKPDSTENWTRTRPQYNK